jgi:hypothetical protein
MRHLVPLGLVVAITGSAVAIDPESRAAYQLRVVVRTGDHPTLTRHFRAEVTKNVTSSLQAALGPVGSVEAVDLNETAADQRDALVKLVDEKGLEALDDVNAAVGGKTHFVFIDFADGKYEIRTRQHDGTTGFVTPMVRKSVHGDRGFVGRLAGLSVAQDFGVVGTFDATGPQVSVVLKAGELGPLDAWVKKGDVFAALQMREVRRPVPRPGKEKAKTDSGPTATSAGSRLDGVLLQVVDGPRNGICVCKLHNRYRSLPRDAGTFGYRCVKLGTGEGPLRLQLTDPTGRILNSDAVQPRAGAEDFPTDAPRAQEETTFAGGIFTSKEPFKHVAFVLVRAGDAPIAKIPVEIYPEQLAVRRVNLADKLLTPVEADSADLLERIRTARVIQARAFEDLSALQKKEKPKALQYGQTAHESLSKEVDLLRADLARMKDRYPMEAGRFDPCEGELKTLEAKTRDLRAHLNKLRDFIKLENDPATAEAHKRVEEMLLEAATAAKNLDYDVAIAKYEEALKQTLLTPSDKADVEKLLEAMKRKWDIKDPAARKFVYEVWAKLENPQDVKDALPEARKAVARCKEVGDKITLQKMYETAPAVIQRYKENLTKLVDAAGDDPDKLAPLAGYEKVNKELKELLEEVGKAIESEVGK